MVTVMVAKVMVDKMNSSLRDVLIVAMLCVGLAISFVISEVIISEPTNKVCVRGDNHECR